MIEKIISGACPGADMAGLYAAEAMGIPTGGFNWNNDARNDALHDRFGIVAASNSDLLDTSDRTQLNVIHSDCTLHFKHGGEAVTIYPLKQWRKPYHEILMMDYSNPTWMDEDVIRDCRQFILWMRAVMGRDLTINIAGNADTEMETLVKEFLEVMLEPLIRMLNPLAKGS